MKTIQSFLLIGQLLFLLACGGSSNQENADKNTDADTNKGASNSSETGNADQIKRYGIQSGIIKYKLTGLQTGEETLYFDQWGMREAKFNQVTTKLGGVSAPNETLTILNNEAMYIIDPIKKTGIKAGNNMLDQLKVVAANAEGNLAEAGLKMLEAMGGKREGTGEVLGKTCEIWVLESTKTKMWVWKGITLKSTINIMGTGQTNEAIDIQTDTKVPSDKFKVPEGIKLTDMPAMVK